jgi:hypothetical protein
MRRASVIVVVGIGLLSGAAALVGAAAVGAREAAIPAGNLVQNPGAETNAGGEFFTARVPVNGWTMVEGADASLQTVRYTPVRNGRPSDARLPSADLAKAIGGGRNFFGGWYPSRNAAAFQTIAVGGAAPEIDGGGVKACLSAYLGGSGRSPNATRVTLEFLDEGEARLGQIQAGPVTRGHRRNVTTMLRRIAEGRVPANTRALRVTITMQVTGAPSNYSSADNVSVALTRGACEPLLAVRCAGGALVATVTPSAIARTQRVTFRVRGAKGSRQVVRARAPYSARVPMAGFTGQLTVTATVIQAGAGSIVLTKKSRRC